MLGSCDNARSKDRKFDLLVVSSSDYCLVRDTFGVPLQGTPSRGGHGSNLTRSAKVSIDGIMGHET
jgi:hypothetical protein